MLRPLTLAPLLLLMAACQPATTPDDPTDLSASAPPQIHMLMVERAYTLEDSRDQDFRDRIAAAAEPYCGRAGPLIQSLRPVGTERIGEDFLYRMVEVGVTCRN